MKIKVIKANVITGKEQRYEPVTKPLDIDRMITQTIQQWIFEYKERQIVERFHANDMRVIR